VAVALRPGQTLHVLNQYHSTKRAANVHSMDAIKRLALGCGLLACFLGSLSGCSRQFFRVRADKEVKYLITQKSNDPRWEYLNYTIGMDPRSRYFDPTNPDCPPMPYDDPASHRYMKCVAGRKQWPCWDMSGHWYYLENPQWKDLLTQYNEVTDEGAVKLTMNGAVCLAQVHSSDYRQKIETIYLSALDVSTERFRFDVQFFGNSATLFDHEGPLKNPGLGEQNSLTQNTDLAMNRQFSAGGELMVGLANQIVWQFAGPDTNVTTSLLNFSFLQPLLRNGGRAFVMERLTIVERALLANLRAMQFYRQGFYTQVTIGAAAGGGPQRQGGFFGGTGLTGFSGQGASGFGGVGSGTFGIQGGGGGGGGGASAGAGFVGGGAGQVGGFIGLLQQKQQIANLQLNLNSTLGTLGLLEANLDAGLIDIVQVDQFRQNIETTRANLLSAQVSYQNSLDQFKAGTIGLAPDTNIELDDSMLAQFQFLDPDTIAVQRMIDEFVRVVGELPEEPSRPDLLKAGETLAALRTRLADQFASAQSDMEKLTAAVPDREKSMSDSQKKSFEDERKKLLDNLQDVTTRFTDTDGALQNLQGSLQGGAGGEAVDQIVALGVGLSGLTQELALVKARTRLETVTIPHVDLDSARALDIARANRLDWMNNRASLVDQWRLITFNANQLKAGLDLTFAGDMGTVGNNPVSFNGKDGSLRVGVRFEAPFTRRLERNDYRSALIFYQQQRRALYQYQDGVNLSLRSLLRSLAQLETNMEIQRRAVVIAVRRVDKTREDLNKPPAPVQPGMPVEALGPTVGQNLIFALNDLTNAQNNLMSVVLNYYETRMLLYRALGIMELDDCGMWIERPIEDSVGLTEAECPMPPGVPTEWMEEAGVDPRTEGLDVDYEDGSFEENDFNNGQPAPEVQQVRRSALVRQFAGLIPSKSSESEQVAAENRATRHRPQVGLAGGAIAGLLVPERDFAVADVATAQTADSDPTTETYPVQQAAHEEPEAEELEAVPHDRNAQPARPAAEFGEVRRFGLLVEMPEGDVPAAAGSEPPRPLPSTPTLPPMSKAPIRLRR
jgi:hypothetical protein